MSSVEVETNAVPLKRATSVATSDDTHDDKKQRKPGRKPVTTDPGSKRTAQNRAAQRAFRERKQQYLKGLEDQVSELTERHERTERENQELRRAIEALKNENTALKGRKFTYESIPDDFGNSMLEMFDSGSPGLGLSSTLDMQQAALQGADLTQPGAMDAIGKSLQQSSSQTISMEYPAVSAVVSGYDPLLSTTSSNLPGGFNANIFNGLQMLTANQNISTGSFIDHLIDSTPSNNNSSSNESANGSKVTSTPGNTDAQFSNTYSRSPSTSTNAATTPGDMIVPLGGLSSAPSNNSLLSLDAFKNQNSMATFASLLAQSTNAASGQTPATPSLSDLLSLSPSQGTDGSLIGSISSPSNTINAGTSQSPYGSVDLSTNGMHTLPPYLMAYRNGDPTAIGDDGDQLEKLLLNSMYSLNPQENNDASNAPTQTITSEPFPSNGVVQSPTATTAAAATKSSSQETSQQQLQNQSRCTCRNLDDDQVRTCPIHGSPSALSEELHDIAPQMMEYVCTENNRLADDELNDLCTLMFKHAKCAEVQERVGAARKKLKSESERELSNTRQQLAKQYGLY
ncbi:DNA-binding transcription factor yap1 [Coemansia guatemalensis]|uniref:DNA-binding transcription factor yap1 n=1 Tax=Coemansia guatemalensis TaxID=2761395 RepID=A0A9W8LVM5_9FUNG|nr:DNA-binding transcription factor yap1 [Coemansia guatemalensis]